MGGWLADCPHRKEKATQTLQCKARINLVAASCYRMQLCTTTCCPTSTWVWAAVRSQVLAMETGARTQVGGHLLLVLVPSLLTTRTWGAAPGLSFCTFNAASPRCPLCSRKQYLVEHSCKQENRPALREWEQHSWPAAMHAMLQYAVLRILPNSFH